MRLAYHILIRLYALLIRLAVPFSSKAKYWISGRKQWLQKLPEAGTQNIVWFHCASLGEYQQAKPLIEAIKESRQNHQILLTFFSPSGYLNVGENENVDFQSYMPLDTLSNANEFVKKAKPVCAIFIQSELWPNFLDVLREKTIPTFVVSANFKPNSHLFKFFGKWHLKLLKSIHHFYVLDESSQKLLHKNGIQQVSISGDNRYDKVIENRQSAKDIPYIVTFKGSQPLVVAGSTYKIDSKMLVRISKRMPNVKFIIAPHNTNYASELEQDGLLYSQANENNVKDYNILIIDNIGMLSQLYQYANLAYIGGAFGSGLHNILEALAFDSSVIFGPNYHKFKEAKEAIIEGVAQSVSTEQELESSIKSFLENQTDNNKPSAFCMRRKGANDIIMQGIKAVI